MKKPRLLARPGKGGIRRTLAGLAILTAVASAAACSSSGGHVSAGSAPGDLAPVLPVIQTSPSVDPSALPSGAPSAPDSSSPSADTSTPPAPSASASASAVVPAGCVAPATTSHQIGVTLNLPADSPDALTELKALAGSKFTEVYYLGANVNGGAPDANSLKTYIATAYCAGKMTIVDLDSSFNAEGETTDAVKLLVQNIDGTQGLVGYALGQNGSKSVKEFNDRVAAIKSVSSKPITGLLDFNRTDNPSVGVGISMKFKTDVRIPIYLPWQVNPNWPVDAYKAAGQQAVAINQSGMAAVGVQAFDWGPQGKKYGFTKVGLPSADQGGKFVQMIVAGGATIALVYAQEPSSDNAQYLTDYAAAVFAALN